MMFLRKFVKEKFILILMFILFLTMCYMFPYTHDDWDWGSNLGIERLNNFFENYNGRYAGNLLVLLITRNKIIRALIESITILLIIRYIYKLSNPHQANISLIITFLLLMPISIFRQSIAWASGFANYVIPILLVLFFINKNKHLFEKKNICNENSSKYSVILFFIVSFVGSLFIENITIYNLLLSIFFIVYEKIITKKISLNNLAYSLGSFLGTITMFSNSVYLNIISGTDTYRTIESSNIILTALKTYAVTISDSIFNNNIIICSVLAILLLLLVIQNTKDKNINTTLRYCSIIVICLFIANIIYTSLPENSTFILSRNITLVYNACIGLLFTSAFLYIVINYTTGTTKRKLLFYFGSIIGMNLPLLIISPLGPRLFLSTYIFFILIILELLNTIKFNFEKFETIFKVISMILLFYLFFIYLNIYVVNCKQQKIIKSEKYTDTDYLYIPSLPFSDYLHYGDPVNENFMYIFKNYYEIDQDKEIIFY